MATGLHKVQVATVNGGMIQATEGMWPTGATNVRERWPGSKTHGNGEIFSIWN